MNYSMNPSVEDFLEVASNMRQDEIDQYLSITGYSVYNPQDFVASVLDCLGEIRFGLYDNSGNPYCVGGLIQVRHKVWQTWMAGTPEGWDKNWRSITKLSRRAIDDLLKSDLCNRVQCYSLHSRHKTHEWYVRGLGLELESINRKFFADGQNAACHVKIKE